MQSTTSISKLNTLGEDLFKFFETTSTPCTLKDIHTKKLNIISEPFAALFDTSSPKVAVGATVRDLILNPLHPNPSHNERYVQYLEALDDQVCEQGKAATTNHATFIDQAGFIRIERLVKSPVFNHKNKPVGIISYAHNLTPYYDLISLFELYQAHYTETQAIRYCLQYLKTEKPFAKLPTYEEMSMLLTLYTTTSPHSAPMISNSNAAYALSSKLKYGSLDDLIDLFFESKIEHKQHD